MAAHRKQTAKRDGQQEAYVSRSTRPPATATTLYYIGAASRLQSGVLTTMPGLNECFLHPNTTGVSVDLTDGYGFGRARPYGVFHPGDRLENLVDGVFPPSTRIWLFRKSREADLHHHRRWLRTTRYRSRFSGGSVRQVVLLRSRAFHFRAPAPRG